MQTMKGAFVGLKVNGSNESAPQRADHQAMQSEATVKH
jgi:hypothetical protein